MSPDSGLLSHNRDRAGTTPGSYSRSTAVMPSKAPLLVDHELHV